MGYTPENNPYIPGDPYSYDLAWMVDKIQEWTNPLDSAERAEASAQAAEADRQQAEAWAVGTIDGDPVTSDDPQYENNSKHWADESASSASNAAASEASAQSYANHIADPVSGIVTSWLEDNVSQPTTPAIDKSLKISGAGADAKVTGIYKDNIINSIIGITDGIDLFNSGYITSNKYWTYTGAYSSDAAWCVTDYMPVIPGKKYFYTGLTNVGSAPHSQFFDSSLAYMSAFKQATGDNFVVAPAGAAYVSFSVKLTDLSAFRFISPCNFTSQAELAEVNEALTNSLKTGIIYQPVAWEQGTFSNANANQASTTRIRTEQLIDFSEYSEVTIELDNGYEIIRLDYYGSAPYNMTSWISSGYTFPVASGYLYRFALKRSDEGTITPAEASHVKFKVAEIDSPTIQALKNASYQTMDTRPTYVILDYDDDITSLSDNRVTLVNEQYGHIFSFVGIADADVTKELLLRGCDLSIYSNEPGYLPNVSTINSSNPADILAWDNYVAEVLGRYNAAGFYNQTCWSCQGNNFGSALETALRKYGFKMARGNQVGGANSIYIDHFDDSSFRIGYYQIYSNQAALALQQVTNAVNSKQDICIFTHKIVDTPEEDRGYDCTKTTYTDFLDGLQTKISAGEVRIVSFREYYKMHCFKSCYEYDYNRIFRTFWG